MTPCGCEKAFTPHFPSVFEVFSKTRQHQKDAEFREKHDCTLDYGGLSRYPSVSQTPFLDPFLGPAPPSAPTLRRHPKQRTKSETPSSRNAPRPVLRGGTPPRPRAPPATRGPEPNLGAMRGGRCDASSGSALRDGTPVYSQASFDACSGTSSRRRPTYGPCSRVLGFGFGFGFGFSGSGSGSGSGSERRR